MLASANQSNLAPRYERGFVIKFHKSELKFRAFCDGITTELVTPSCRTIREDVEIFLPFDDSANITIPLTGEVKNGNGSAKASILAGRHQYNRSLNAACFQISDWFTAEQGADAARVVPPGRPTVLKKPENRTAICERLNDLIPKGYELRETIDDVFTTLYPVCVLPSPIRSLSIIIPRTLA